MKMILLCLFLQIGLPIYEFKSTSSYLQGTQEHLEQQDNSSNRPKPRKVSGIGGWIDWLTWGQFNGVPSSATNEQMYAYYNYIQNGGILSYNDWLNSQSVPIPDPDVTLVLCLALLYLIVIERKKQRKSRNEPYITKLSKNVYLEKIDK